MARVTHVIPETLSQCSEVLHRLMALPILSFFIAYDGFPSEHPTAFFEQNPGFPSLGDICTRLESGAYSLPSQFYWDVWGIFKGFSDFFKDDESLVGRAFRSLASFGTDRFMKWCAKAAQTEAEAHLRKLRKARKMVASVERSPLGGGGVVVPDFGTGDVPGKIDPIEYYPIE
jgi:hypothetical protein